LIFERIKDELKSGHKLHKAIHEWFEKSWSAIWDSNVTGLIISVILFVFWVNLIKGFGLMLGIWIIVSLFTAMFVSRLFVLFLARNESKVDVKCFIGLKK
jgi:preprotein translocase subunit SecD